MRKHGPIIWHKKVYSNTRQTTVDQAKARTSQSTTAVIDTLVGPQRPGMMRSKTMTTRTQQCHLQVLSSWWATSPRWSGQTLNRLDVVRHQENAPASGTLPKLATTS